MKWCVDAIILSRLPRHGDPSCVKPNFHVAAKKLSGEQTRSPRPILHTGLLLGVGEEEDKKEEEKLEEYRV